jgi:general secretion pathway protein B
MSLILEALRKSEAERRRGQTPQLFDPPATAVPAASKRHAHALWWAMPVVLSAVLLVLWRYAATPQPAGDAAAFQRSGTNGNGASTAQVAQRPPAAPGSAGAGAEPAAPVSPAAPATIAAPRSAPVARANPESTRVERPSANRMPVEPTGADRTPPATAAATRPEPAAAAPPTAVPTTPSPAARAPRPAAIASARSLPEPATPDPAERPVTTPAAKAEPRMTAAPDAEPLRLADLAPVDRRALPPLKMSMHMWSADAAQRFMILDGARVGEGDRVGEAVVDEITRDGAILVWSGRRVKVPVR